MVDIRNKRCLHISCTKRSNFNVKGSKTAVYCKQHSEEGMVYVYAKRFSSGACTKLPNSNVEGRTTAAHCKNHAEDGMVNVRSSRSFNHDSKIASAQDSPDRIPATACTRGNPEILIRSVDNSESSCDVVVGRKRSRRRVDGIQLPRRRGHSEFKQVGVVQAVGACSSNEDSFSAGKRERHNDNTVAPAAKQALQAVSPTMAPSPDEHQSGQPVKIEMELVVSL